MKTQNNNFQKMIIKFQINELTESIIYSNLSKNSKNKHNKQILQKLSNDEIEHHNIWKKYSGISVKPNRLRIFFFTWISRLLGLSFGIKLMEMGEVNAQIKYKNILEQIPEINQILDEEQVHEKSLIDIMDDKILTYMGSIVLGLNDALVELTGVLAGLTLGLQNPKLIVVVGLITGISASFSMGASEYLSIKTDGGKNAFTSSIYTWLAYLITVIFLVMPFLFVDNPFVALPITMFIAIIIIAGFNRYLSIAKEYNFKKRFLEMASISIGVAIISFGIGFAVRNIFSIDI